MVQVDSKCYLSEPLIFFILYKRYDQIYVFHRNILKW